MLKYKLYVVELEICIISYFTLGGTSDGVVSLWDIGQQISLPSYDGVNPQQLLKVISFVVNLL